MRRGSPNGALFLAFVVFLAVAGLLEKHAPAPASSGRRPLAPAPIMNPIAETLRSGVRVERREGVAAAILIDTSGSMGETVRDVDGSRRRKIEIAKRAAADLVNTFAAYAREHMDQTVYLGIYEFSDRGSRSCREIVKLGPAGESDPEAVRAAISNMRPAGGTPIGDAMITAKLDLAATGLSKPHILVISDGENNKGYSPSDVTRAITTQEEGDRASVYFVAFDVAEGTFKGVRDAGGLVLAASNETELKGTLDYLLTGKILAEQPEAHR